MKEFIFEGGKEKFSSHLKLQRYIANRNTHSVLKIATGLALLTILFFYSTMAKPSISIIVTVIVVYLLSLVSPILLAWLNHSREQTLAGAKDISVSFIFSDKIYLKAENFERSFELSELTDFVIGKDYYIFKFNKRIYTLVDKEDLKNASYEEFENYINNLLPPRKKTNIVKILNIILAVWMIIMALLLIVVAIMSKSAVLL